MAIKNKSQLPTSKRPRRQYRQAIKAVPSKCSPLLPHLPESELDIFFECGPFSVLCQGATDAEIAEDFRILHAAIEGMADILLASAIPTSSVTVFEPLEFFKGGPKDANTSEDLYALPVSRAGIRKPPRAKVQERSVGSISTPAPLTPESPDKSLTLKDSIISFGYDRKKDMGSIAPISFYGQLEMAESARLRAKKRGLSEDDNRTISDRAKQFRPVFLH